MEQLLFRVTKGEELTDLELDDNFRRLRAAINALEASIISSSDGNPIGTILNYAPSTLPTGYLWANGQAISRSTYSALFAAIGTTFGVGDGVSTFNLPDFRGRICIGTNPMGGSTDGTLAARVLGTKYGAESVTVAHTHTGSFSIDDHEVSITPSGSVAVNNFVGTSSVSISATIGTTNISYTPTGTATLDSLVLSSHDLSGVTIVDNTSGSPYVSSELVTGLGVTPIACAATPSTAGETFEYMPCDNVTVNDFDVQVSLAGIAAGLLIGGSIPDHTVSSSAISFVGDATNFNHTHSISSTSGTANLNHGHTATFTGSLANQTLSHSGTVSVDSSSPSVGIIPPTLACNSIIKY